MGHSNCHFSLEEAGKLNACCFISPQLRQCAESGRKEWCKTSARGLCFSPPRVWVADAVVSPGSGGVDEGQRAGKHLTWWRMETVPASRLARLALAPSSSCRDLDLSLGQRRGQCPRCVPLLMEHLPMAGVGPSTWTPTLL